VITHCRRQQFYFGRDGRIARHDYVADVVGWWARGSHFWEDYQEAGGLQIARRRRVVLRIGKQPTPIGVLRITTRSAEHATPVAVRRLERRCWPLVTINAVAVTEYG
jgi:hypothetical protein